MFEVADYLCDSWISNLANTAAVLYHTMPDVNWVGFYLLNSAVDSEKLTLGPFQGKPACMEIQMGRGVCGTAAQKRVPLRVPDVSVFPGHITCDPASRSELVIPMINAQGTLLGVLDVDSAHLNRFSDHDRESLERVITMLLAASKAP
jgi:L-methionine (R)-S-oxide reductase